MFPSSSTNRSNFDVFVSFRGEDIRENFLSHLQSALITKNVNVFDDNEFQRGMEIEPAIIGAIERSRISVVIFSKNYADSEWCLDELVKIMECKEKYEQIVLPVFFRLDPAEVGNQSGSYGRALADLEEQHGREKVERWRRCLSQATYISGWDSNNIRNESELVTKIVIDILRKLGIADDTVTDNTSTTTDGTTTTNDTTTTTTTTDGTTTAMRLILANFAHGCGVGFVALIGYAIKNSMELDDNDRQTTLPDQRNEMRLQYEQDDHRRAPLILPNQIIRRRSQREQEYVQIPADRRDPLVYRTTREVDTYDYYNNYRVARPNYY